MNFSNFSFSQEPTVYIGVIDALIVAAISFGVPISVEQKTALDGVVVAFGLMLIRSRVTPTTNVKALVQSAVSAAITTGDTR